MKATVSVMYITAHEPSTLRQLGHTREHPQRTVTVTVTVPVTVTGMEMSVSHGSSTQSRLQKTARIASILQHYYQLR